MINGNDLIDAGWHPSSGFRNALEEAKNYSHLSKDEILEKIQHLRTSAPVYPVLDSTPKGVNLAIDMDNASIEEALNFQTCISNMLNMSQCPKIIDSALMPDACPTGSGITVGGVVAAKNAIIPAAHSADVCCSMYLSLFESNLPTNVLMDHLVESTHFGYVTTNDQVHLSPNEIFNTNKYLKGLNSVSVNHMGTQGDGNHFAYIGNVVADDLFYDSIGADRNKKWKALVTHHGSRGLGAAVYKRGLADAIKNSGPNIPAYMSWIDFNSNDGKDYWDALQYLRNWTKYNHLTIHDQFLENIGLSDMLCTPECWNEHNFVWKRNDIFYHGKGATPMFYTNEDDKGIKLIPLNMNEPILITAGPGNNSFMNFAPHGAGRNISRTQLKKNIKDHESALKESTMGIDVRWFAGKPDISESPLGYKNAKTVIDQIKKFDLANIIGRVEPLGCVMAGELDRPWIKKNELGHRKI